MSLVFRLGYFARDILFRTPDHNLTHLDLQEPKDKACRYSLSAAKIGTSGIEDSRKLQKLTSATSLYQLSEHTVEDLVHSKKGKGTVHGIFQHGNTIHHPISPPSHPAVPRDKTQPSDSKDQSYHTLFSFTDAFQGKWVTILRVVWSPNPDVFPHFTIRNMNYALDIYSCKGHLIVRLKDSRQVI
ncbi:hypothetical protein BD769DRAFT_1666466 [Suillus cothurnatus]|nr:hypothetical protein BD769DRAFT_1666466 [Suillus cothurnatus]